MNRVLRNMASLGVAVALTGCATEFSDPYFTDTETKANVYVGSEPSSIVKVAVLPFKAPTELIGLSVSDMFVTELLRTGRYELVERGQMTSVLNETELALAGLSAAKAIEVGSMLGAEGVVIGTVDEYASVAVGGHAYPSVGVSARLIDCKTGKVVWSVDLGKRAKSKKITLAEHSRSSVHEMTAAVYQSLGKAWKAKER